MALPVTTPTAPTAGDAYKKDMERQYLEMTTVSRTTSPGSPPSLTCQQSPLTSPTSPPPRREAAPSIFERHEDPPIPLTPRRQAFWNQLAAQPPRQPTAPVPAQSVTLPSAPQGKDLDKGLSERLGQTVQRLLGKGLTPEKQYHLGIHQLALVLSALAAVIYGILVLALGTAIATNPYALVICLVCCALFYLAANSAYCSAYDLGPREYWIRLIPCFIATVAMSPLILVIALLVGLYARFCSSAETTPSAAPTQA